MGTLQCGNTVGSLRLSSKHIESGANTTYPLLTKAGPNACNGFPANPHTSLLPK